MSARTLDLKPLTAEAFAPFGDVIETRGTPRKINNGHALRFHDLAQLDVDAQGGRAIVSIFRSTPPTYPFAIRAMEHHPLGSQAFIPMSGRAYVVVVAPAGKFVADGIQAFVAKPTQGVNFRAGVWHHFNLAYGAESEFLVIDRDGPGRNLEEVFLPDNSIIVPSPEHLL